jgi:hypothetical protein
MPDEKKQIKKPKWSLAKKKKKKKKKLRRCLPRSLTDVDPVQKKTILVSSDFQYVFVQPISGFTEKVTSFLTKEKQIKLEMNKDVEK